jgi:hypothetical protein
VEPAAVPAASIAVPLFVDVPASRLLRLPAVLLLDLTNEFLEDEDAQKWAQCCSAMPPLLRSFRIKAALSLQRALQSPCPLFDQLAALPASLRLLFSRVGGQAGMVATDQWLARMRFGVTTPLSLDAEAVCTSHLGEKLHWLSPNHPRARPNRCVPSPPWLLWVGRWDDEAASTHSLVDVRTGGWAGRRRSTYEGTVTAL